MNEASRRPKDEPLLPWENRWDAPRTNPAVQVPDNATQPKTLIYGPRGEALMQEVPRPVGFRRPER